MRDFLEIYIKPLIIIILIIILGIGIICGISIFLDSRYKYYKDVECEVVYKQYDGPINTSVVTTSITVDGKVAVGNIPVYKSESWNVKVKYNELDLYKMFDNEELFNNYKEGEMITLKVYKHKTKEEYELSIR